MGSSPTSKFKVKRLESCTIYHITLSKNPTFREHTGSEKKHKTTFFFQQQYTSVSKETVVGPQHHDTKEVTNLLSKLNYIVDIKLQFMMSDGKVTNLLLRMGHIQYASNGCTWVLKIPCCLFKKKKRQVCLVWPNSCHNQLELNVMLSRFVLLGPIIHVL